MTTITLTLTAEQEAKLKQLAQTREGKTQTELLQQVIDRGLYDLGYRTKRNKENWQQFKAWKQTQKQS